MWGYIFMWRHDCFNSATSKPKIDIFFFAHICKSTRGPQGKQQTDTLQPNIFISGVFHKSFQHRHMHVSGGLCDNSLDLPTSLKGTDKKEEKKKWLGKAHSEEKLGHRNVGQKSCAHVLGRKDVRRETGKKRKTDEKSAHLNEYCTALTRVWKVSRKSGYLIITIEDCRK